MISKINLTLALALLATCVAFAAAPPGNSNAGTAPANVYVMANATETLFVIDEGLTANATETTAKMAVSWDCAINSATTGYDATTPKVAINQGNNSNLLMTANSGANADATAAGSSPTGTARSGPSNSATVAVPAEEVYLGD